jgi:flagellar operon protein
VKQVVSKIYGPQVAQAANQVGQVGTPVNIQRTRTTAVGKTEFQKILEQKTGQIEFSAHASKRLAQRGIELTADDMDRLTQAVDRADDKGSKESLVLLNGLAFVVSVSNRTVITAIDVENMKENVVTNIDSAVIA